MGEKDLASLENLQDYNNADSELDTKNPSSNQPERFGQQSVNFGPGPYNQPSPNPNNLEGVECYACTNCPRVTPDTLSKICPYHIDPFKRRRCVVYAEKYKREYSFT